MTLVCHGVPTVYQSLLGKGDGDEEFGSEPLISSSFTG